MEYRCRLGTPAGEIIEGVYVADSEARLRRELEEKGLYVLAIRQAGGLGLGGLALPRRRSISTREFLVFNQELATLLKAGMPLVQSLDILRQRLSNPVFKAVLDDVYERVRGGGALSEAFEAQGDLFPGVYTATLFAGEKSGSLEQVLRRYVAYTKVLTAVRRRTISALVYPAILLVLSLVVVAIIMLKVVPEFAEFYKQFDRELPLSTRIIVESLDVRGELLAAHRRRARRGERRVLVLAETAWSAGAVRSLDPRPPARRTDGPEVLDVAGRAHAVDAPGRRHSARERARHQRAVDRATSSWRGELQVASQQVREGRALASAMNERGQFPDVAIKMVEVGESTGALQDMLNSLADFYDEEIETGLGRFVTLVEPLLLVTMGIVIAGLLLALYMPLFQLSSVVRCPGIRTQGPEQRHRSLYRRGALCRAQAAEAVQARQSGRALPARVRRHGALQHRPRAVPADSGGSHASLRLRAVPPRRRRARHRRVGSDRPADDRRAGRAARRRRSAWRSEPRRRSRRSSRRAKARSVFSTKRPRASRCRSSGTRRVRARTASPSIA